MNPLLSMASKLLILLSSLLIAFPSFGHGDLHERIKKVSQQIDQDPDSTYLYLKRGILYFQHEEYNKSIVDLKICEERQYNDIQLDLTFAKVYLRTQEYIHSLSYLDRILTKDPVYVNAWRLKGQVFYEMEDYDEAAVSFMKLLDLTNQTLPFNYLDASLAFEKMGSNEAIDQAISVIERGINDLGPLITFQERMVHLGLSHGQYDLALLYQTAIIDHLNRKESAFFKRAMIYLEKDEVQKGYDDLILSKKALEKLPSRHKNTKAMQDLYQKIESHITELNKNQNK